MGAKQLAVKKYAIRHLNWFVFGFFTLLALLITIPFIFNPLNTLISPFDGDAGYSSIIFEGIKRENLNPFVDGRLSTIAYPDGVTINTGVNRVSFFSTFILWAGTLVTNAVFIHSLLAIIGTILSAFFAFLFVRKITNSIVPALLSGLLLGFFPLMIAMLFSAYPYTHMWLYIVVLWGFWGLTSNTPSLKRLLVALGIVLLAMFWTPYFTYHVLLIAGTSTIVLAFIYAKKYGLITMSKYVGAIIVSLAIFVVLYYVIGKSSAYSEVPVRTIEEIYQQSAQPLMYVLPGMFSIFGHEGYKLLVSIVPRAAYTTIQLGVVTIVVALVSLRILRKPSNQSKVRYAVLMCASVAIVLFCFSLAPTISLFGVSIPTPNYIIAEFTPALRAGQRLAMPLMATMVVMFGIGMVVLLRRMPKRYKIVTVLLVVLVAFFELASFPPSRYTVLAKAPLFDAMAKQEAGLTATYREDTLVSNPGQKICYLQFQHKMPLVNDCSIQRDPYNFNKPSPTLGEITKQPLCKQVETLYNRGVTYLILEKRDTSMVRKCLLGSRDYRELMSDESFTIYKANEKSK